MHYKQVSSIPMNDGIDSGAQTDHSEDGSLD